MTTPLPENKHCGHPCLKPQNLRRKINCHVGFIGRSVGRENLRVGSVYSPSRRRQADSHSPVAIEKVDWSSDEGNMDHEGEQSGSAFDPRSSIGIW